MKNSQFVIVTIILVLVGILALAAYLPTRTDIAIKTKVANFPMAVGEWQATELPLSELDFKILETKNLFVRDYKNPQGESVVLYVVYSEDNRKVSHPPEVCYMGGGVTIVDKSAVQLTPSIKAIKMTVENKDSQQMVVYTFKAGDIYTDQYTRQQWKVVIDRLFGKRTAGALIRFSVNIKDNNPQAAFNLIKSFCSEIEPLLAKHLP
jgi:EpsI family protein